MTGNRRADLHRLDSLETTNLMQITEDLWEWLGWWCYDDKDNDDVVMMMMMVIFAVDEDDDEDNDSDDWELEL